MLSCLLLATMAQRLGNRAEGATCQTEQASGLSLEVAERKLKFTLERGARVPESQQTAKPSVPARGGDQKQQTPLFELHIRPHQRTERRLARCLPESGNSVNSVAVGQTQCGIAQLQSTLDQLLGKRSTFEERKRTSAT